PPVPDGTAAKKLHYHQRVDPIDPRQFNPEIPDELTLILARMMAKDPAQRYPDPEHLLSHLVALARQLGYETQLARFPPLLDSRLPAPPRPRPFITAVSAAVALVLLLMVLRPGSWPSSSKHDASSGDAETLGMLDPSPPAVSSEPSARAQNDTG